MHRGIDTRPLAGGVLVGIHGRDRLVAGRHRGQTPVATQRHADPIGPPDRCPGQGHVQTEGPVDHVLAGPKRCHLPPAPTGAATRATGGRGRLPRITGLPGRSEASGPGSWSVESQGWGQSGDLEDAEHPSRW